MKLNFLKSIELLPFPAPEYVNSKEELSDPISLLELNWETLNFLCDQFRKDIFEKAAVKDHKTS